MLRSAGLQEEDVTFVTLPAPQPGQVGQPAQPAGRGASNRYRMAQALARGDVDFIAPFEPEADVAVRQLGNDGIVFQEQEGISRGIQPPRPGTGPCGSGKAPRDCEVRAGCRRCQQGAEEDPKPCLPISQVSPVFTVEEIVGWPETGVPRAHHSRHAGCTRSRGAAARQVERYRPARRRTELAKFIDRSVVEEALKLKWTRRPCDSTTPLAPSTSLVDDLRSGRTSWLSANSNSPRQLENGDFGGRTDSGSCSLERREHSRRVDRRASQHVSQRQCRAARISVHWEDQTWSRGLSRSDPDDGGIRRGRP